MGYIAENTELMEKEIQIRYDQILKRSFKYDLKLFLFEQFLDGNIRDISGLLENYHAFTPKEIIINKYLIIRQLAKSTDIIDGTNIQVGEFDNGLKNWQKENKSKLVKMQQIYKENRFIKKEDFQKFYDRNLIRECYYCSITESQIEEFVIQNKIYTKRLLLRGRTLEIDKKDPKGDYSIENIVFCCYWCNNAKTDEFTHEEFKKIGRAIKETWQQR